MKNNPENPWQDMAESTQRRISSEIKHDLFWITDLQGHYGFCVKSDKPFIDTNQNINLKGIFFRKRNTFEGRGELFLLLNNKEDWEIFYTLCMDLVSAAEMNNDSDKMIYIVENRLIRWKQLLKSQSIPKMTLERQMGLFSELTCLRDIIAPKYGLKCAIHAWCGPEFDKQDFATEDTAIEVKSYRTTKGKTVYISSAEQLSCQKDFFYLTAYGLTVTDAGKSIEDIVTELRNRLQESSYETIPILESKLIEYGYIPEFFKDPLYKFVIDDLTAYAISSDFPRISPDIIDPAIGSVKYDLDLSKCEKYEIVLSL